MMKRLPLLIGLLIGLVPPLVSPALARAEDPGPQIAARVGDVEITVAEVNRVRDDVARSRRGRAPSERAVLETLINARVLEHIAREEGFSISEAELTEFIEQLKSRMKNPEDFEMELAQRGLLLDDFRRNARNQLLVRKYRYETTKDLAPTDEEVEAEYKRLKDTGRMERPETVDVAQVFFRPADDSDSAWEAAKKRAEEARARVAGGEPIEDVAREVSDDPLAKQTGGVMTHVPRGVIGKAFDDAAFSLDVGALSEVFKEPEGWRFVQVKSKYAAGTISFIEARQRIRGLLHRQAADALLQQRIDEAKPNIKIEILMEFPAPDEPEKSGHVEEDLLLDSI